MAFRSPNLADFSELMSQNLLFVELFKIWEERENDLQQRAHQLVQQPKERSRKIKRCFDYSICDSKGTKNPHLTLGRNELFYTAKNEERHNKHNWLKAADKFIWEGMNFLSWGWQITQNLIEENIFFF